MRVDEDGRSSIRLGTLDSVETRLVLDDVLSAPILAPTPSGRTYLLFMRDPDLMVQEFDETSGTVVGNAIAFVSDIGQIAAPPVRPMVGVSPAGVLAYQTRSGNSSGGQLKWLDRSGAELGSLAEELTVQIPRLSPYEAFMAGSRVVGSCSSLPRTVR